jgi:tetratricopeptide (TPR) repeat protein
MTRAIRSRCRILAALVVAGALGLALPALAQSTGMVKGKVTDGEKKPVEGAQVKIEAKDGVSRQFTVKTNKKGEYIQVGLMPGMYQITATKEGVGAGSTQAKISLGAAEEVDLTLVAAGAGGAPMSKEEAAYRKAFDDGVAASKAGKHDEAIAKFQEALKGRPDCYACQFNIGAGYAGKQDWAKAEEAFLAAAKLDPNSPEPYNALAGLYNTQKQYDKAAAMTAEATKRQGAGGGATGAGGGGGASAETLYNQGVILWNAGKIAEAKGQFEAAVKAKPDYADAHYRLGMAYLNEGKLPEAGAAFEKYVELAPNGQWAAEAKTYATQLKPKE